MLSSKQLKEVKKTVLELSQEYVIQYNTEYDVAVGVLDKNVESLTVFKSTSVWDMKEIKIPKKKPFTTEYVLERLAKLDKRKYVNHRDLFQKVIDKLGLNLTANSYGFGMESMFSGHTQMHKQADIIKEVLDKNKILYTISVSDASWVFRFNISKTQKNLKMLKELIK